MNISTDQAGAKIIVFVVAIAVVIGGGWLLYKSYSSQVNSDDVCKEQGSGTHIVPQTGPADPRKQTVVVCEENGTSQSLQ